MSENDNPAPYTQTQGLGLLDRLDATIDKNVALDVASISPEMRQRYRDELASHLTEVQKPISDLDIQLAYEAWVDRTVGARAAITAFYAGYRAALTTEGLDNG